MRQRELGAKRRGEEDVAVIRDIWLGGLSHLQCMRMRSGSGRVGTVSQCLVACRVSRESSPHSREGRQQGAFGTPPLSTSTCSRSDRLWITVQGWGSETLHRLSISEPVSWLSNISETRSGHSVLRRRWSCRLIKESRGNRFSPSRYDVRWLDECRCRKEGLVHVAMRRNPWIG